MDYVNLGATGLRVSRDLPRHDELRQQQRAPWVLDEDAAEPIVRAAADGGITFFDTADVYSAGASEVGHRPAARQDLHAATRWWSPPRCTAR